MFGSVALCEAQRVLPTANSLHVPVNAQQHVSLRYSMVVGSLLALTWLVLEVGALHHALAGALSKGMRESRTGCRMRD
jgi:hypothetical protein